MINHTIEESKHNNVIQIDNKYIYVRRFAPHMTLKWSKREILEDKINRSRNYKYIKEKN